MVEAMHGAGVQAIKMRGGMPLLGVGRVFGFYRFANMLALLDRKLRPDAPPEEIVGSRGVRQLRLAHRPAAGAPDGDRQPDRRLRPVRRRAREARRADRDELDLHEDARRRTGSATRASRARGSSSSRRLHADREQGRRDHHPAARHRRRAVPRRGPRADREEALRPRGGRAAHRPAAARADGHRGAARRPRRRSPATSTPSSRTTSSSSPTPRSRPTPPAPPFTVGKQVIPNELRAEWGDFVVLGPRRRRAGAR